MQRRNICDIIDQICSLSWVPLDLKNRLIWEVKNLNQNVAIAEQNWDHFSRILGNLGLDREWKRKLKEMVNLENHSDKF